MSTPEGMSPDRTPWHRSKDIVKMNFKYIDCDGMASAFSGLGPVMGSSDRCTSLAREIDKFSSSSPKTMLSHTSL
jgi:hypothetical protein